MSFKYEFINTLIKVFLNSLVIFSILFAHLNLQWELKSYKNSHVTRTHNAHHKEANYWTCECSVLCIERDYQGGFFLTHVRLLLQRSFVWLQQILMLILIVGRVTLNEWSDRDFCRIYFVLEKSWRIIQKFSDFPDFKTFFFTLFSSKTV